VKKILSVALIFISLVALSACDDVDNDDAAVAAPQIPQTITETYTWDCEYPVQKPDALTLTCGDGGMYVDKITWSTWDSSGAEGTGYYNVNDCTPDCADGTFRKVEVKVSLSNVANYNGEQYLRTMRIESQNGESLPESGQDFMEWDLMDFAEMMNG
jgi:hypothetical protein